MDELMLAKQERRGYNEVRVIKESCKKIGVVGFL